MIGGEVSDQVTTTPRGFVAEIPVRWSDMDAYQHVNHARMVTLLEEARIPFLYEDHLPTASGAQTGTVIVDVHIHYKRQLRHSDTPLRITMWIGQVRAADYVVHYEVRAASDDPASVAAVTAETQLATFDVATQRLRRLDSAEQEYLRSWLRD